MFKKIAIPIVALAVMTSLLMGCACSSDADVASKNISKAAEQFEVNRRIILFNGITDKYVLVIEGFCSVETSEAGLSGSLEITCKVGNQYRKLFYGLSDNVSYLVEQIGTIGVSTNHYRVIFKPEAIVPNFDRP